MDPKEAIAKAKNYVLELYEGEPIVDIGLEEIRFDEATDVWDVTVGFQRVLKPTHVRQLIDAMSRGPSLSALVAAPLSERIYKVVSIANDNGDFRSMTDRQLSSGSRE